jgi:protein-S-isoprenylcysteine O-methyltransferase Ste14
MNSIHKIASWVAFGTAVCGIVLLVRNDNLFTSNVIGISVQALAVGLMIWARITFGKRSFHPGANPTEGGLVMHGPYRVLRHPIYAAVAYFVWAGVLSHHSIEAYALAIIITLCLVVRMLLEEKFLMTAYPEYKEYSRMTKRLIPFLL